MDTSGSTHRIVDELLGQIINPSQLFLIPILYKVDLYDCVARYTTSFSACPAGAR